jgi:ABC-type multidrug transport system fused ATPase/permease subunit
MHCDPLVTLFVFVLWVSSSGYGGQDWWLSMWTASASGKPSGSLGIDLPAAPNQADQSFYVYGYYWFALATVIVVKLRVFLFYTGATKASEGLFRKLLFALLRSPMVFFETTPIGRIVQRVTYDTEMIDNTLGNVNPVSVWL